MSGDRYIPRTKFDRVQYACGLSAGNRLRLIKRIVVCDSEGRPTGAEHEPGGEWLVLAGSSEEPGILWLQQPDGLPHSWDDDASIFEYFERLGS